MSRRSPRNRTRSLALALGLGAIGPMPLGAGCGAAESIYLAPSWPSDQPVVLVGRDGNGTALAEPRLNTGGPIRFELDSDRGAVEIIAQAYPPDIVVGVEECGVTFGGGKTRLGRASSEWSASVDAEGRVTAFAERSPTELGLAFSGCEPKLSRCDELMASAASVTDLQLDNMADAISPEPGVLIVTGFPELQGDFVARLTTGGRLLARAEVASNPTSLAIVDDVLVLGLRDGRLLWLDPGSLETLRTSQAYESETRVATRPDGLALAYSVADDRVLEISGTSTDTIERADFPPRMRWLQMNSEARMAASFVDRAPMVYDAASGAWQETTIDSVPPNPELAFSEGGLFLMGRDRVYLLDAAPNDGPHAWTPLEATDPPLEPYTVRGFGPGVLVGTSFYGVLFWSDQGSLCTLQRNLDADVDVRDIVVFDRDHAIGVTTTAAGIGTLVPQLISIGPG